MSKLSDLSRNWSQLLRYQKPHIILPSSCHLPPILSFYPLQVQMTNNCCQLIHLQCLLLALFNELGSLSGSSSQPRLIQPPQSDMQKLSFKFDRMESFLKDSGFDSIGEFLMILFYNPSHVSGEPDPWGSCHAKAVARFLQGQNKIKMADIIPLIYGHKYSAPLPLLPHYSKCHAPFLSSVPATEIFSTCPCLFTWATNLVADHVHCEIHEICAEDNNLHLWALTNGRHPDGVNLVTWEALGKFSISGLCKKYKARAPVSWHLTESMAASRKKGTVILKKWCPHPIVNI